MKHTKLSTNYLGPFEELQIDEKEHHYIYLLDKEEKDQSTISTSKEDITPYNQNNNKQQKLNYQKELNQDQQEWIQDQLTMDGFLCTNASSVTLRYFEFEKKLLEICNLSGASAVNIYRQYNPTMISKVERLIVKRGYSFENLHSWDYGLTAEVGISIWRYIDQGIGLIYLLFRNIRNKLFHHHQIFDANLGALLYCAKKLSNWVLMLDPNIKVVILHERATIINNNTDELNTMGINTDTMKAKLNRFYNFWPIEEMMNLLKDIWPIAHNAVCNPPATIDPIIIFESLIYSSSDTEWRNPDFILMCAFNAQLILLMLESSSLMRGIREVEEQAIKIRRIYYKVHYKLLRPAVMVLFEVRQQSFESTVVDSLQA
ncbi:hypothetical protein BC937DRAFT_87676 [Endogone sp. FLAS-F59071]|nr:hypothetical protein BC937DRAFT_87676 [Endogone sp. FLAS-F59071]|eukprot:RUS19319.1 hypothetical protein BC937DRAFT_87676 [Endogone sp. FLAS-F59071]